jgi:hypothetical protein
MRLIFGLLLFAKGAHAIVYHPSGASLSSKAMQFDFRGSIFNSTGNFDYTGLETPFDSGESFSQTDYEGVLRYGQSDRLEWRGGLRYRQNSSTDVISSTTTNQANNAGLESALLGMKYSFLESDRWRYALDVQFRSTFYSNEAYDRTQTVPSEEVVLGDDGQEIKLGGGLSYQFSRSNFFNSSLYFVIPPNELSTEYAYDLNVTWAMETWWFYFGAGGVLSGNGDQYSGDDLNKPRMSTANTALYNSINRSYVKPYLGLAYNATSWKLGFEYAWVNTGVSTDSGSEISLNYSWSNDGKTQEEHKVESFKEYAVDAAIIKISPRKNFVKIDQGIAQEIEKGMRFDIFQTDYFGGNVLVASGVAYEVGTDWAIIKIMKTYNQIEIKEGFAARGFR